MVLTKASFFGKGNPYPNATIIQHGFPETRDKDEATTEVRDIYIPNNYPGWTILATEIVQTPEHVDAGEFVVKAYIEEPTPEDETDDDEETDNEPTPEEAA